MAFVFSFESGPERVPFSPHGHPGMMLVLVGEHCVSRLGQATPRLALEVRRRFIFLGRPLPKNILCSILNILQVLARQGMLAAPEATASFVQLSHFCFTNWPFRLHTHMWISNTEICRWHFFLGLTQPPRGLHALWIHLEHFKATPQSFNLCHLFDLWK